MGQLRNALAEEFERARESGGGIAPTKRTETGKVIPQPGQRPFPADPKNLAPIKEEIERVKAINAGNRAMNRRKGR